MFKENQIRPDQIFKKYLSLSLKDQSFFKKKKVNINCPSCIKKTQTSFLFKKHGHTYNRCNLCNTVFVNPRPTLNQLMKYYNESKSAKYFSNIFYTKTKKSRIKYLWKPKVIEICKYLKSKKEKNFTIYDIGGGYGIFAELMKRKSKEDVIVIEPDKKMFSSCVQKKIPAINNFLENIKKKQLKKGKKIFISFELFEHLQSPVLFLKKLKKLMNKGDLFIFTTLSGKGLDIENLSYNSKCFSIQHLNLFNPISIKNLLNKVNFKVDKIETPGKLDIDILFKQREQIINNLSKILLSEITERQKLKIQKKISKLNLSSHMRVFCSAR
tara:strand:+ start:4938 stop:5915 length:978 start_codon:yes stop_codon:yes gene_type:complete